MKDKDCLDREIKENLEQDFNLIHLLDEVKVQNNISINNKDLAEYINTELNSELLSTSIFLRAKGDDWIEINEGDPVLDNVSGAAAGNINQAINVNYAVNINAVTNAIAAANAVAYLMVIGIQYVAIGQTGGFCCFPRGTGVRNVDGTKISIEKINIGDELASIDGKKGVVVEQVLCEVKKGDKIYNVNNEIESTWEQLFLGEHGEWLAVDIDGYRLYRTIKRINKPNFGLEDTAVKQMKVGDKVYLFDKLSEVVSINHRVVDKNETLHSFVLNGTKVFYANDYAVESSV